MQIRNLLAIAAAAGLALGLSVGLVSGPGCASRKAADTPLVSDPAEQTPAGGITDSQWREVQSAFSSLAQGHQPLSKPDVAASPRGRWSDVHIAVLFACDDTEMAVLKRTEHPWGWEYRLTTVEDWPCTLTIRRVDGDQVYEAAAKVGLFSNHADRAAALVSAFDRHMRAFGRKRAFPDEAGR